MSKKYINVHSVRYHRPTEHCSSQQNQWNLFTRTHTCHTCGPHKPQRERPKDKPPTLENTIVPSHHGAGVGAGQGAEGAKAGSMNKDTPQRVASPGPPTKENSFVTWMTEDVLITILFFKTKNYQSKKANLYPWAFSVTAIQWNSG